MLKNDFLLLDDQVGQSCMVLLVDSMLLDEQGGSLGWVRSEVSYYHLSFVADVDVNLERLVNLVSVVIRSLLFISRALSLSWADGLSVLIWLESELLLLLHVITLVLGQISLENLRLVDRVVVEVLPLVGVLALSLGIS